MMFNKNVKPKDVERSWYLVDADGLVLGRLASKIADVIRGKHRVYYSPQWDMGDYVVVVNANKVKLTGQKEQDKKYYRHTGYPGGIRVETAAELRERKPEELLRRAVKGMLPKNRLSRKIITKLHIYPNKKHPFEDKELIDFNL